MKKVLYFENEVLQYTMECALIYEEWPINFVK
jgi:hypothetical protein